MIRILIVIILLLWLLGAFGSGFVSGIPQMGNAVHLLLVVVLILVVLHLLKVI